MCSVGLMVLVNSLLRALWRVKCCFVDIIDDPLANCTNERSLDSGFILSTSPDSWCMLSTVSRDVFGLESKLNVFSKFSNCTLQLGKLFCSFRFFSFRFVSVFALFFSPDVKYSFAELESSTLFTFFAFCLSLLSFKPDLELVSPFTSSALLSLSQICSVEGMQTLELKIQMVLVAVPFVW